MRKLLFLTVSLFFMIGCGGGGGGTTYSVTDSVYLPIDTQGTIIALPVTETVQGGTAADPAPLTPIDLSDPIDPENLDLFVSHVFGTDTDNNYFEYTAVAGETLYIVVTFDTALTDLEMAASPQFLEVYDSDLQPADVIHDGGSENFTEVYMVYAIKFQKYDTYLLRFGWGGHGGYATAASIAP